MDELVDRIVERTGMPRAQAQEVAKMTINYLKERLPSAANSQIDGVLVGAQAESLGERVESVARGIFR